MLSCLPCFSARKPKEETEEPPVVHARDATRSLSPPPENESLLPIKTDKSVEACNASNESNAVENENGGSRTFTFRELAMATKNFKQESLICEGGFGKVYKGTLQTGEVVAVKRLDRTGTGGTKEFSVEVLTLTLLHHPNLVNLIGYCADGDQRILVYEYLPFGSLKAHLHEASADKHPLDWQTRMKIAFGAAQGLEYLHEKANPPIIYQDLKPSNILLDEDFNPRLSDYGLAKLSHGDNKMQVVPRVMGSYGYCAPEYESKGELTLKSDVYSFGVILLELITGRRALDTARPTEEQNLVSWAQPMFRDPTRFLDMADPYLQGQLQQKSLNQAVGIVAMCLQEEPSVRPLIGDVVSILGFLAVAPPEEAIPASLSDTRSTSEAERINGHQEVNGNNLNNHDDNHTKNNWQNGKTDCSESSEHGDGESDDENPNKNNHKFGADYTSNSKSNRENEFSDGSSRHISRSYTGDDSPQGVMTIQGSKAKMHCPMEVPVLAN